MRRADQTALALQDLVERGKTSGRPGSDHDLAAVLGAALDRYALTRLYLVATAALGRSPVPEPHYFCPWRKAPFSESTMGDHVLAAHSDPVGAKT
jgi:hypothetical protein